jgi:hypothetical protein
MRGWLRKFRRKGSFDILVLMPKLDKVLNTTTKRCAAI